MGDSYENSPRYENSPHQQVDVRGEGSIRDIGFDPHATGRGGRIRTAAKKSASSLYGKAGAVLALLGTIGAIAAFLTHHLTEGGVGVVLAVIGVLLTAIPMLAD